MIFRPSRNPVRFWRCAGAGRKSAPFLAAAAAVAMLAPALAGHVSAAPAQDFEALAARLAEHPSVVSLHARAEGSGDLARAARALPDPVISLGINNVPVADPAFDRFLPTNKAVGVAQAIPNAGVRRARSAQERLQGQQFTLRAGYQIALLKAELAASLAHKTRAARQLELVERQLELYREMERLVRGKLEAGRPVYFRLSEIDVERADVDRRLSELRSERAQIDATLVQLVGVAPDVSPPQITLERWRGNDPHALWPVRIAETEIGKAEAGIREKRAEYRPDFGVRLQYQQREAGVSGGMPFSGDDWFSAGVSVSVPLWAAQNQAPRLRAARAQEAAARASLHDALRATRERLEALYSAHQAAQENLGIFRTKEKSLRELVEAARRNYEAGRGSNIQVLDGEIGLLTLRAQIEDERARALATAARANSFLVP